MTYITELQLEIKAVEFALASFTKYRNKKERVAYLDTQLENVQFLDVYSGFTKVKLKDALSKLQQMKNLLLAKQQAAKVYLACFLWEETEPVANKLFPSNKFGQYVLKRDRVMNKVKEEIALQRSLHPGSTTSVYLSGCRGSGKTSLQILLARSFKAEGYEVYYFQSAAEIPQGASLEFERLLKDKTRKVAVLIDEVATDPNSGLFVTLLKGAYPHLVTIGAAVPRFDPTHHTAMFNSNLRMSDLVLKEGDGDFQELIKYCEGLNATTPELTQTICEYLLKQCGGHTYPTLAFIEYFFTRDDAKGFLSSLEVFRRYFCGPDFSQSPFYDSVRVRCFGHLPDGVTEEVAFRVLGGKEEAGDISTVTRWGWWDTRAGAFISPFLMNVCLSCVKPERDDDVLYLDKKKTPEENAELVVVEGLRGMDDSDFKCLHHQSDVSVQNAVSFNWARSVKARIPNAYLHFQERAVPGVVDFYLNGLADTAIEVMLNATQTGKTRQSQDINAHQERFRDGKYWKRYILFNFAMNKDEVVLPRDTSSHDKVYTYIHSTNALYRGNKLIVSPAVPNPRGFRDFNHGDSQIRSFSTMVRATRPRDVRPLSLSTLKQFLALVRGL